MHVRYILTLIYGDYLTIIDDYQPVAVPALFDVTLRFTGTGLEYGRKELLAILHDHINTVVSRYKDRIHTWSIIEEPELAVMDQADPNG